MSIFSSDQMDTHAAEPGSDSPCRGIMIVKKDGGKACAASLKQLAILLSNLGGRTFPLAPDETSP